MSNNYAPCFNRIDFVFIPSYIELPCLNLRGINCVCVKRKTLCNCLCSSSSCDSATLIRNIGVFGAKSYFTDHGTANTIHGFRGSFPVLKKHGCYQETQRFEQLSIPIQAIQGNYSVLM